MLRNRMRLGAHWTGLFGLGALWAGVTLAQAGAPATPPLSHITATTPEVNPSACPEETLTETERSLHIVIGEGNVYAACRKDPADSRHAIVALAYPSDNGATGQDHSQLVEPNDYDFLVDIVIVDIASGNILIQRRVTDDFDWTGGFVDIWIDTARYDLAPGLRAFGVRIQQHENCGNSCEITNTQLALYMQRDIRLQTLLTTYVGEHEDGAGPDGEGYAAHRYVTVLCMGRQRRRGLADIWAAERRAWSDDPNENVDINAVRVPCGPTAPNRTLWRYNGKHYE